MLLLVAIPVLMRVIVVVFVRECLISRARACVRLRL